MWTYPSLLLWPSYNLTCDISNMKLLPYILFTQTRTGFYPEEVRMHQTAKYGIMHTSHQRKENHVFKMESWFTGFLKEHTHTHTHTHTADSLEAHLQNQYQCHWICSPALCLSCSPFPLYLFTLQNNVCHCVYLHFRCTSVYDDLWLYTFYFNCILITFPVTPFPQPWNKVCKLCGTSFGWHRLSQKQFLSSWSI